ncbi:hypothetical protein QBC37DRAFT_378371 [Rhypophila decipiens]|uniref:Uncharacterized protein n=1 Tax=Rhypophila decipiens TaxID=261697 RepID=A0AAN6XYR9_9PEZI|nr:hypothetical protein QBC37DRAFT_378371 [Rhypophila decipiens]
MASKKWPPREPSPPLLRIYSKRFPTTSTSSDSSVEQQTAPPSRPRALLCTICKKHYTSWGDSRTFRPPCLNDFSVPTEGGLPFIIGHVHTHTDSRKEFLYWTAALNQSYPISLLRDVRQFVDKAVAAHPNKDGAHINLHFFLAGASFATTRPTVFLDCPDHGHANAVLSIIEENGIPGAESVLPTGFELRVAREHDGFEVDQRYCST